MHSICSFFDVVNNRELESDENVGTLVEQCSCYDSALSEFSLVCRSYKFDSLKGWVHSNCGKISHHACSRMDSNMKFSMDLVKSALRIKSFTEEFVKDTGSVQGFLDRWGNSYAVDVRKTWEREPDAEADLAMSAQVEEVPDYQFPSDSSDGDSDGWFFDGLKDGTEDGDSQIQQEDEVQEEDSGEEDDSGEDIELLNSLLRTGTDGDASGDAGDGLTTAEEKPVAHASGSDSFQGMDCTDVEDVDFPGEGDSHDRIKLPMKSSDGREIAIPVTSLLEFANCIRKAAEQLETDEIPSTELLTPEDKQETLTFIDEYSPSMFKRFFLDLVRSAESDMDYIRVTKLLDEFCKFIDRHSMELKEVSK